MCALPRITLQDRVSPLRRIAALSGPVADKGLRKWVYQAQAYERAGIRIRAGFTPPKTHVYIYIYIHTQVPKHQTRKTNHVSNNTPHSRACPSPTATSVFRVVISIVIIIVTSLLLLLLSLLLFYHGDRCYVVCFIMMLYCIIIIVIIVIMNIMKTATSGQSCGPTARLPAS